MTHLDFSDPVQLHCHSIQPIQNAHHITTYYYHHRTIYFHFSFSLKNIFRSNFYVIRFRYWFWLNVMGACTLYYMWITKCVIMNFVYWLKYASVRLNNIYHYYFISKFSCMTGFYFLKFQSFQYPTPSLSLTLSHPFNRVHD